MHFKEIITAIKERREALQVTQEYLAAVSGIGLRTLKKFESGTGNPTLNTLQRMCEVLGMEISLKLKELNPEP